MKIAVDLIPVKIDGTAGGAMNLVAELLKGLGEKSSHEFLLLTAYWNNEFFKDYERYGMKFLCLLDEEKTRYADSFISKAFKKIKNKISTKLQQKFNLFNIFSYKASGILKKHGIDLLFCPMSDPLYAEDGIKTVSIIHDIQHEYYENFFDPQELEHRRNFYRKVCNKTDAVICVSNYTRKTFLEKYDYPSERAYVVHTGIRNRFSEPSSEQLEKVLEKYNLKNISYGFYPANFWPHKNHRMLLTAFSRYIKNCSNVNFNLVFTGASIQEEKGVKKAVEVMGIKDRVHFLGYLPEDELACVFSSSEFIVFPSLFEGFGIPVLEGMKWGKPVLSANSTGLPEVGGDGVIYFNPVKPDEIIEAFEKLKDDIFIRELLEKSEKQVRKFTLDNMVKSYLNVFEQFRENT